MLDELSYKLMDCKWLPYRYRHAGGPLNTVLYSSLRRRKIRPTLDRINRDQPDDFTIVIGTSQRQDFRLVRALQNLRSQDYPQQHVHIILVDYGNNPSDAQKLADIANPYNATIIRTAQKRNVWNRGHCLNVGIRRAKTKFTLTSDVDILFAPDYLAVAARTLRDNPFQVVYARSLDLPQDALPALQDLDTPLNYHALKATGSFRNIGGSKFSNGINCTYTWFYHHVQGYDEFFERWGSEDNDLSRRMSWLGLKLTSIIDRTGYLHQWHPKHEGVNDDTLQAAIERNRQHEFASRDIIVNDENWGSILPDKTA